MAQTAERFGKRPSDLIEIENSALALDFDITCSYRLLLLDLERARAESEAMSGGESRTNGKQVKGKITKDTVRW